MSCVGGYFTIFNGDCVFLIVHIHLVKDPLYIVDSL